MCQLYNVSLVEEIIRENKIKKSMKDIVKIKETSQSEGQLR